MIKKLLIVLIVLIAIFCVVAAMQPSSFRISRSTTIAASQEVVYSNVNDLHAFQVWSPWSKIDPHAKTSFEGPIAGPGASFAWAGNSEVGEGRMTITESRANELVLFRLDFKKPFAATNIAEFKFQPEGDHTKVTWSMSGNNNFIAKAIGLIIDCDKMVGGYFEKGLANLKTLSETPQIASATS
jgi:hypothetical protein